MAYELWSTASRNLLGSYETEEEALAAVRRELETLGREYANELLLGFENSRGRPRILAQGADSVGAPEDPARQVRCGVSARAG